MIKRLAVEGMSCGHCVMHVKNALEELSGVKNVQVSLEENSAQVDVNESVSDELLKNAVEEVGYSVTKIDHL